MSEMIERIQRAIAPMIQASGPIHAYDSHAMVRAALEAMREPTEEMKYAGDNEPTAHSWGQSATLKDGKNWEFADSEPIWSAMIQVILKEGK